METQKSILQDWMDLSKWAASGGNAQPWQIEHSEMSEGSEQIQLTLAIDPNYRREHSPLDAGGAAALIALGGLCLYFTNVAAHFKYELQNESCSVSESFWESKILLIFNKAETCRPFYSLEDLRKRRTNRYPFLQSQIPDVLVAALHNKIKRYSGLNIIEIQSNKKKAFIEALLPLEKMRWQKPTYLESLLLEISWNSENTNVASQSQKIPIEQLGLAKSDQMFFRLLNKSKLLRYLVNTFLYRFVVPKALDGFSQHCDRLFVLQAKTSTAPNCIELGKALQECWIVINKESVAFQPLGTPLVALGYWFHEEKIQFSLKEKNTIGSVTDNFMKTYNIDFKLPTMAFRIGYATKVHDQAPRKSMVATLLKQ